MASPPQPILDALNAVQSDADSVAAAQAQAQATATALAQAQTADQSAQAAVVAAKAHLVTDLQALIALEQQTYGAP